MFVLPFHALADYSSLKVALAGLLLAFSCLGSGAFLFGRLFGRSVPLRFSLPISTLLGIHVYSLIVQLLGFAHLLSPVVLQGVLFVQVAGGSCFLLATARSYWRDGFEVRREWSDSFFSSKAALFLGVLLAVALFANFVISLAPSTKSDEVYDYMHLPLKMLMDSGMRYYALPRFLFLPQMHYHVAAAPFYALGLTDALNVLSWALSALFVFFAVAIVFEKTRSATYSLLIACGLYVGMHSPVWYVTGGYGSFALLGMSMLIYMVLDSKKLVERFGSLRFLGMISLLSMSTASSKLSNVPLAILCLAIVALYVWRESHYRNFFTLFGVSSSFWVVLYLPALAWTWGVSGFFLGPMGDPVNAAAVASAATAHRSLYGIVYQLAIVIADLTPFVWGGTFLFLLSPWIRKNMYSYVLGTCIFCTQAFLILWKMPLVFRYFGGVHFALALYFWATAAESLRERFAALLSNEKLLRIGVAACLGPWIFLQLFYASSFFPVVLGVESAQVFVEQRTPFFADFQKLDVLLPEDALLFVNRIHMPIYTPRRAIFEKRELVLLQDVGPLFAFSSVPLGDDFPGYSLELIYKNETAVYHAFRTPGRSPELGMLAVYHLTPSAEIETK